MKTIVVDGSFIGKRVTGVQRFNWEVLRELAKFEDLKIYVAVAEDVNVGSLDIPRVEVVKRGKKNNKKWQLFTLKKIADKLKAPVLGMSNFSPLFKKSYVVLHDVTFLDKQGKSNRLWSLAYRILVSFGISKHKKVFTVSEFSKSRILYHYKKLKEEQVVVVGNGGGHWLCVGDEKPDIDLEDGYFLSVGSTTNNKNFDYVISLAKHNPDKKFIVVGRLDGEYTKKTEELHNIIFTGYISNENLHYLYNHCNGFILPSFYEGFGLPPLEALNCGCRILAVSDIPVFKEVYGPVANFFDPYDYENTVDLDSLNRATEEQAREVMEKYSWANVAKTIYENLEE